MSNFDLVARLHGSDMNFDLLISRFGQATIPKRPSLKPEKQETLAARFTRQSD